MIVVITLQRKVIVLWYVLQLLQKQSKVTKSENKNKLWKQKKTRPNSNNTVQVYDPGDLIQKIVVWLKPVWVLKNRNNQFW